jgi:glycosyltransferase involved in cell wall biosynthesis
MNSRRVKIVHLISSLYRGGRERQLVTIVSHTDLLRYTTRIIYYNKNPYSYTEEYGLNEISIQLQSVGKMRRLLELHRILKKEKPDLVYTWGNDESVGILLLKPFHRFRLINGSIRHGIRSRRVSHYFRTLVLHCSRHIVANSKAGLKANGLRRGHVLYNGIDGKFLGVLPDRVVGRRSVTGIPEDVVLMVSVANLIPYKDYFSVLKALKALKNKGYRFYYLILGEGPLYEDIMLMVRRYGLGSSVRIVGNVENVDVYLKVSDIFIHSSRGEGCSNAILEAMAAGLPIVASDTGGTREIVSSEHAMLFQYKNHEQLAGFLAYLMDHPQHCRKMGVYSRQKAVRDFAIAAMMSRYYSILESVISPSHAKKALSFHSIIPEQKG